MNEIIKYESNHECVPNGVGDYDFVCPTRGIKPGFIPYFMRTLVTGTCACGLKIKIQKEVTDQDFA